MVLVTCRPHEIDIAEGHRRPGEPRVAFASHESCKPAFAHEAAAVVCAAFGGADFRDSGRGTAKRAGAGATSGGAGCAERYTDVSGDGTAAADGAEPQSGLAGLVGVHEEWGQD